MIAVKKGKTFKIFQYLLNKKPTAFLHSWTHRQKNKKGNDRGKTKNKITLPTITTIYTKFKANKRDRAMTVN